MAQNGAEPGRPCPARLEAPRDHRSARDPAGGVADRREPQRRHPAHAPHPGHPAGARPPWPAPRRPDAIYADRGYDHDKYRRQVRKAGITPVIARRSTEHGSGLGVHRWVIEQSIALLHWFRRLRIRWEIRDDIHEAFLSLACAIICWRQLANLSLC